MYNSDTELIFPIRVIPELLELRGPEWENLVQNAINEDAELNTRLAFVLMMVKLGGCGTCNADSFRAMRGCTQCATRTIRRYKGNDSELVELHQLCQKEVDDFVKNNYSLQRDSER